MIVRESSWVHEYVRVSSGSSSEPEDTLTYSWTHDDSLTITFADPAALSTTFTAPNVAANTTVTVTLTVNDGTVDVSDTLQVTINGLVQQPARGGGRRRPGGCRGRHGEPLWNGD